MARKPTYTETLLGPRKVGGRYWNAYWGKEYTVDAISIMNGIPQFAITWADGQHGTHCTGWSKRDKVISQPE